MYDVNGSHLFVLGFDHGDSYFQHAVVVVTDFLIVDYFMNTETDYFSNFLIYIGDNTDYTQNPQCEGGPFMTTP